MGWRLNATTGKMEFFTDAPAAAVPSHDELSGVTPDQHHLQLHGAEHVDGTDIITNAAANGDSGLMSGVDKAKLDVLEAGEHLSLPNMIVNVLTDHDKAAHEALAISHGSLSNINADTHHTQIHAASHTDGTDDIQDATAAQKGLMTLAYAGKLDGIEASATADQTEADILTLLGLTGAEVDQVGNIAATTISEAQWGYLGSSTAAGGAVLDAASNAAIIALLSGEATATFNFGGQALTDVASATLASTGWLGLAVDKGRLVFTDAATDTAAFMGCRVSIGGENSGGLLELIGSITNLGFDATYANVIVGQPNVVSDTGEIALNYVGYNYGATKFRDVSIYDGKTNLIARFDGSSGNTLIGFETGSARLCINGGVNIGGNGAVGDNDLNVVGDVTVGGFVGEVGKSRCIVELGSSQDIPSGSNTTVEFNTEVEDVLNEFNTGTYRFVAAADGKYLVTACVRFNENLADSDVVTLYIRRSGVVQLGNSISCSAIVKPGMTVNGIISMTATQYLDAQIYHDNGVARQLSTTYSQFSVVRVG